MRVHYFIHYQLASGAKGSITASRLFFKSPSSVHDAMYEYLKAKYDARVVIIGMNRI